MVCILWVFIVPLTEVKTAKQDAIVCFERGGGSFCRDKHSCSSHLRKWSPGTNLITVVILRRWLSAVSVSLDGHLRVPSIPKDIACLTACSHVAWLTGRKLRCLMTYSYIRQSASQPGPNNSWSRIMCPFRKRSNIKDPWHPWLSQYPSSLCTCFPLAFVCFSSTLEAFDMKQKHEFYECEKFACARIHELANLVNYVWNASLIVTTFMYQRDSILKFCRCKPKAWGVYILHFWVFLLFTNYSPHYGATVSEWVEFNAPPDTL